MRVLFSITAVLATALNAAAHFPIMLHDSPWAGVNEPASFFFVYGHPYEHEWEDTESLSSVMVISPQGVKTDITDSVVAGAETLGGQEIKLQKWEYTPQQKGDHIVALESTPYISRSEVAYQDFVKITLHVERQDGWRNLTGQPVEIVPLTRPYGLEAGSVFTGQVLKNGEPVAGTEVEIERYLPEAPNINELPPDPLITRVVVTDPNGVFHTTLTAPGWWIVASYVEDAGTVDHEGNTLPMHGLGAIYIHVDEALEK